MDPINKFLVIYGIPQIKGNLQIRWGGGGNEWIECFNIVHWYRKMSRQIQPRTSGFQSEDNTTTPKVWPRNVWEPSLPLHSYRFWREETSVGLFYLQQQWRIQDFPEGCKPYRGCANLLFGKNENERIFTEGGITSVLPWIHHWQCSGLDRILFHSN